MDFSLKQALGAAVVVGVAGLVITAAVALTNTNNTQASDKTSAMWTQVGNQVNQGK